MLDKVIKEYIDGLNKKHESLIKLYDTVTKEYHGDKKLQKPTFIEKVRLTITGKKQDNKIERQLIKENYQKEINRLKKEINISEESIQKMQDKDNVIYTLYKNNNDLFNNPKFMEELLEEDIKYIVYDKTNDDKVYRTFATKWIEKYRVDVHEYYIDNMNKFISEIDNPKEPESNKYKIPHMFLYEYIRKQIIKGSLDNTDLATLDFSYYFENDCKYDLSYGKKIEELYLKDNSYLYFAGINDPDKAFDIGYNLGYGTDMSRNFWEAHSIEESFLSIISPGKYGRDYTIFALVPKDIKNILGSNGEIGTYSNSNNTGYRTYLMPEYIVGAAGIKDGEAIYIENPYKLDEREKYLYQGEAYLDGFKYDDDFEKVIISDKSR